MNKKQLIKSLKNEGFSFRIVKAFENVPRERFISKYLKEYAYEDIALPLEKGATISQPYTIAFMLDLLELNERNKDMRILEIGSGCGYVLVLLYEITNGDIYGIELSKKLVSMSKSILKELKYDKVKVICGNGYFGLKEKAPFDRILISASSNKIPEHLFEQLKDGGIMIVPVGNSIFRIRKNEKEYEFKEFRGFAFVPLRKD